MSNTEQMRKNLLDKIKELFQLNQPDLDFGFYRIMHSRAKEITEFIEKDLLATIEAAFASAKVESFQSEFDAAKKKILDAIGEDAFDENGTLKPAYANSKAGREFLEVQRKLASSEAIASGEESVYYHLYKFFSRYYDNGDFISTRYHTRETDSMAKPYAIPYGGEEVMLYWANADQYYIKTSENFNNFSFDLTKAKIFDNMTPEERILAGVPEHALPVHFKVVEAEEGEHGNIKADSGKKREFFLAGQEPVALNATGELEVRFEYRLRGENDTVSAEKEKQVKDQFEAENKGDISLLVMTDELLSACDNLRQRMEADGKDVTLIGEFITAMKHLSPTDKVEKRVLITRYLYQYTARNTADYFIHKNLRGFLRREMDFYIKNEIMNLDDVENSDVATVENYLILLKVFRRIAGKLIDFLGQLEDFQKKLWLKKKFVVQCDYCITIDRIPEKFYPAIFSNQKQL
ncbi:MAG: site-specific DNA-methyltransferase, partial [Victivallaceae bacterium]